MEEGSVKIALCISGQTRSWKRCYRAWIDSVSHLGDVDIFYHFWNYNTLPNQARGILRAELERVPVSKEELQEIRDTLKPKSFMIQPERHYDMSSKIKNPIALWTRNQFYSVKYAAFLKRCYEIENNFEYDIVCRIRSDLILNYQLPTSRLQPNTIYTCVNHFDQTYNIHRVGDIYFYADSFTYDQMANFYDCFDYVDAADIVPSTIYYPPEIALYYYIKSMGISNKQIFVDAKIVRTPEYVKLKGSLDIYESL